MKRPAKSHREIYSSFATFGASRLPRYFQSRISAGFCFKIPNPEIQIREIPDPEKPIEDPLPFGHFKFKSAAKRVWITLTVITNLIKYCYKFNAIN